MGQYSRVLTDWHSLSPHHTYEKGEIASELESAKG